MRKPLLLRFVVSELRNRRLRAAAVAITLAVAASSFLLVTATGKTTDITVRGRVQSAFRPAYDILVRPRGSFTQLERRQRLVRNNYLSGVFGGITLAQWRVIRRLKNVEVAAPIANVGYVLPLQHIRLPLDSVLTKAPVQLYRLRVSSLAEGGASRYPGDDLYVYYTRRNEFVYGRGGTVELVPGAGALSVCSGFERGKPRVEGPFAPASYLSCFSRKSPGQGTDVNRSLFPRGRVGSSYALYFPLLIAAVDPVQEAALLDLPGALVAGRYLRTGEGAAVRRENRSVKYRAVPVLASTTTYVDEVLTVEIERLRIPKRAAVPSLLASDGAYRFLLGLPGTRVSTISLPATQLYHRLVQRTPIESFSYWSTSETHYRGVDGRLVPLAVENPRQVWRSPYQSTIGGYWLAPAANQDLQFRRLNAFVGSNLVGTGNVIRTPALRIVGRYDPAKLPGFNPLSRVPLETYYPPLLTAADTASRRALHGRPLMPTENLGNYIQQPPLLLTTLEAMKPFLNPVFFAGAGKRAHAPISVIRVRVRGVEGPDAASMARIRGVALAIRYRTGLDVDITAGSSPRTLELSLPPGRFGRPRLLLHEGWVKKGVSVAFLRAVDRKSLALSALILLACGFFVANAVFAGVRTRRREIATLLCIGWSRRAVFASILGEVAVLSVIAGVVGAGAAAAIVAGFALSLPIAETSLVLPIGLIVGLLAALPAAWLAARLAPLRALRDPVVEPRRGVRVRGLAAFALVNLRRLPLRTATAGAALVLGVAALTLLIGITRAFEGTFVGTLLGDAILLEIRARDFASAGIVVALAGLALADVLFLNLRERAPEIVALRTFGWSYRHLARVIALEAVAVGLAAGLLGGLAGIIVGAFLLGFPLAAVTVGAIVACAGAVITSLAASLLPLRQLAHLTPAVAFADD